MAIVGLREIPARLILVDRREVAVFTMRTLPVRLILMDHPRPSMSGARTAAHPSKVWLDRGQLQNRERWILCLPTIQAPLSRVDHWSRSMRTAVSMTPGENRARAILSVIRMGSRDVAAGKTEPRPGTTKIRDPPIRVMAKTGPRALERP